MVGLVLFACGGTSDFPTDEGSQRVELPALYIPRTAAPPEQTVLFPTAEGYAVQAFGAFVLAYGGDYPRPFRLEVPFPAVRECMSLPVGRVRLDQVEVVPSSGLNATIDGAAIVLTADVAGNFELTVTGRLTGDDGPLPCASERYGEVDFAYTHTFQIRVRRPVGVRFRDCPNRRWLLESQSYPWRLNAELFDVADEGFRPINVDPRAPMGLTVVGHEQSVLRRRRGEPSLADIEFGGAPGPFEIRPEFGDPIEVKTIAPNAIDQWDVRFVLPGVTRNYLDITEGGLVGGSVTGLANRILIYLDDQFSDGVPLCSAPRPSVRVDVVGEACALEDPSPVSADNLRVPEPSWRLGPSIRIVGDGRCEVTVTGRGVNLNRGLVKSLVVDLEGAERLVEPPAD